MEKNLKNKNIIIFFLVGILFVVAAYWFLFMYSPGGTCIQVLQDARNPITGQVNSFSTPCAVPIGWQKIGPVILK